MKSLLFICFLSIISISYSQQHATANTQCQLSVEEILLQQSFDIDEPVSEDARYIFFEMYEELNLIYTTTNNDPQMVGLIDDFNETLQKANDLSLNLTMFQQDIDYVANLNP